MAPRQKPVASLKRQQKQPDVEDWVYRFLGNLAAVDSLNVHKAHPSMNHDGRSFGGLRRVRSPTPYAWAQVTDRMDSDEEVEQSLPSNNTRSRTSKTATTADTEAADQRTLLQRINHYIRAGIAEGKRRAKRYVRKALSFALETGYLLPADREGKLLRVAPSLVHAVKPVAARKASLAARAKPRQASGRVETHRCSHTRNRRSAKTRNGETRAERKVRSDNDLEDNKRRRNGEFVVKRSKSSEKSKVQPRKSSSAHAGESLMDNNKEATDGAVKPAMRADSEEVDRKPPLPVT